MRFQPLMILGAIVCLSAACTFSITSVPNQNPEIETSEQILPADVVARATPYADSPAAGICGSFEGEWVTITIYPDIPDPRCAAICPDQMLEVVNLREETLIVKLHYLDAEIPPGESRRFEISFGELLLPGVHHLSVQPCCGAELVLRE